MTDKETKVATKLFNSIKKSLASAKKLNKEKPMESWNRSQQSLCIDVYSEYGDTNEIVLDRQIGRVANKLTDSEICHIFAELGRMLDEQKKVKGWGGLYYKNSFERSLKGTMRWISKVGLANPMCAECKSLINYIKKYGNYEIQPYSLFSAAMGGKRGVLWDEYGERLFLDNKPKKCERILNEMRERRGSKDKMSVRYGHEDYIDDEERRYSEYHEVECEGERRYYVEVTITSPSGKVKYSQKIY